MARLPPETRCKRETRRVFPLSSCLGLKRLETERQGSVLYQWGFSIRFAAVLIKLFFTINIFFYMFSQHFKALSSLSLYPSNEIGILKSSLMEAYFPQDTMNASYEV